MADPIVTLVQLAGAPASIIALALWVNTRLKAIEEGQREIRSAIPVCQAERRRAESELHDRVTDIKADVAHMKGRLNGHEKKEAA